MYVVEVDPAVAQVVVDEPAALCLLADVAFRVLFPAKLGSSLKILI